MKIACVCAMGLGSSLILRMTVETALKQLHMKDVEVEVVDTSTARGSQADIIVSSHSFCEPVSYTHLLIMYSGEYHCRKGICN